MQKRLSGVASLDDVVTALAEDAPSHGPHLIVVLDEEDGFRPTQGRRRRGRTNGIHRSVHAREVDLEGRALARLAVDPNAAAALLDDTENRGKAQSGTFAGLLRREERLEDTTQSGPV